MYTVVDLPERFQYGRTDADRLSRLASGVQTELQDAFGEDHGKKVGFRLVWAGFHFHSSEIATRMAHAPNGLSVGLGDTPQFVAFSGFSLASTAYVSMLDQCASAVYLRFIRSPLKGGKEAHLARFFDERNEAERLRLPDPFRRWLDAIERAPEWAQLKDVRDHFAHRYFPINIGGAPGQAAVINGEEYAVGPFLARSRAFAIDRFIEMCLALRPPMAGG